ncbi:peptide chain release factor N(5)-glutamine methyltransferase [Bradyrhizobium sp. ARR65]|uniref:peptide chain release factor N(5)-glutamine methyltransferase n=1 Tax=Bradyrhizobium sp. ARR65 TaxID=1040989 RepID=UPI0004660D0C|nr:peptide chain release factor N(5)-glutamine methyltransferase [Bradyrhizobium sp. ARR65]
MSASPGQTLEAARRALAARFKAANIDSAELDARMLLGAALKLDLTALIASAARRLTQQEVERLRIFAERRISGEPVARILGEKEFWGLQLKLAPETLVPRPDTETVVELALQMLPAPTPQRALRILDIGTGSGAILLALLSERPDVSGVGTDISEGALKAAKSNAAALGLLSRAAFVACDYAAALSGPFDLVVSNPPYIPSADIAGLGAEVREHDPHQALDGGVDGLTAYRALIPDAARLLGAGGALVVEAGYGQSGPIEGLMTRAGFAVHEPPKMDLAGIPRAVGGRKIPR